MAPTAPNISNDACETCGHRKPATIEEHRRAVTDAVEAAHRAGITINVKRGRAGLTVSTRVNFTQTVTPPLF